jgi:hypothetical protein
MTERLHYIDWLRVLVLSLGITFALYEGIRRLDALRFLFGMRLKKG